MTVTVHLGDDTSWWDNGDGIRRHLGHETWHQFIEDVHTAAAPVLFPYALPEDAIGMIRNASQHLRGSSQ